jgi:eukaryotic-like serine/threonine-protein kinase
LARPNLYKGAVIDGFQILDLKNRGGMASLWNVSHPGYNIPLLMKVPHLHEGEDPAAIVSFEMEQMIWPRLKGVHVPRYIASGDFSAQPYIVMEMIPGKTLLQYIPDLPLPYDQVIDMGIKIATALDDLHRQHVIHLDMKPSNVMFRPTGEAVLIDYGLAHHDQLPDLMQEEFHLPYGTAPYMAPEQILGVRNDPRSDLFALGSLLYFFTTGVRPFGQIDTLKGMKRRLWRDPVPPRKLRPDYPPWLQEIVLRCLEVKPAWRHPTAAQLAFDLAHPSQVKLTARSERLKRDPWTVVTKRRFNPEITKESANKPRIAAQISSAPVIVAAIDLQEGADATNEAVRVTAGRLLASLPSARLACINVLKLGMFTIDSTLDDAGHNKHVDRLVALRHWAEPLKLTQERLTIHVLEAIDPAGAILDFVNNNRVDHIVIGARQSGGIRHLLGSVAGKIMSEATCSVTVVRPPRIKTIGETPADFPPELAIAP